MNEYVKQLNETTVVVLRWGQGAQPPKSCPGPQIFNWFYSNFA